MSAEVSLESGFATRTRAIVWWREAFWVALIVPLITVPFFGAPRALLAIGSLLAFWRVYLIARRALGARQHEFDAGLSTHSNWALLASLSLVVSPHLLRVPGWLTMLILLFVGWRIAVIEGRMAPPPRVLLVALVSAASGCVFLQYGTLFGREAGVALLSIMIALKLLELKTRRDATVLLFLACFLVITHFLYSQTLSTAVLMLAAVWMITATMISLQQSAPTVRGNGVTALRLLAQSVPLMIVLFLFFPRLPGPLWGLPRDASHGVTGLSDSMSPGSFGQLSASADVAFRVEFDGPVPRAAELYWRGPVFWQFDGRIWSAGTARTPTTPASVRALGDMVAYTLTLEPHFERWLLALDMPTALPADARLTSDGMLLANAPVRNRIRYEGRTALQYRVGENQSEAELQRGLELPARLNPRARALAVRLRKDSLTDRGVVDAALALFRNEPFFYTTSPPLLDSEHTVDQFLFQSRRGFCEHYASSFAFLMRAAGVPARVVTGYQGGVLNPVGNYLVVRQAEAHAWTEVWLRGEGWVRVDPTAAVSPLRVEAGIAASIPDTDPLPLMVRGALPMLSRAGFAMDALANGWNQWVLSYNTQRQQQLLRNLGLQAADWRTLSLLLLAGATTVALTLSLFALRGLKGRPEDPVRVAWDRLCGKLARAGLPRRPEEGPDAFARRVINARPDLADSLQAITSLYVGLRYARPDPTASTREMLAELRRRIRLLKT